VTHSPLLSDIIEACDAIAAALLRLGLDEYKRNRLVRSSVERDFIIIGEAIIDLMKLGSGGRAVA